MSERRQGLSQARSGRAVLAAAGISLLVSIASYFAFPLIPLQNDSLDYWRFSLYLRGFSSSVSLFLPPGYPALLAAVEKISGTLVGPAMLAVQHLLRLTPFALFLMMARLWPASIVPALAALLWAVFPESYLFAHYLMSESLAVALVSAVMCAVMWLAERPVPARSALAGAAVGALALTRPAGGILLLAVLVPLWHGGRWAKKAVNLAALLGAFILVLLPWAVHNRARAGSFMPVNSTGRHLFNRVVAEDGLVAPGDRDMAGLNALIGFGANARPTYWWNYSSRLGRKGLTESESDAVFFGIASRAVAAHPGRYVSGTLLGAIQISFWPFSAPAGASGYRRLETGLCYPGGAGAVQDWMARRIPGMPEAVALQELLGGQWKPNFLTSGFRIWLFAWRSILGWWLAQYLFLLAGLIVLAFNPARGGFHKPGLPERAFRAGEIAVAVAVVAGLVAHAAFEMPVPRYGLPFQPLVLFAWGAGLVAVNHAFLAGMGKAGS